MAKLMIDYDGLERNRNSIMREKEQFETSVRNLENIITEIQSNWVGKSSNAYAKQFENLKATGLTKVSQLLEEIANQLNQVTQNSDSFDDELAGSFTVE